MKWILCDTSMFRAAQYVDHVNVLVSPEDQ